MSRVIFTTLTVLGLVAAIGGIAVAQQAQQPVAAFTRPDTSPAAQGQFASRCAHSHAAADDPIVFPGEQGAAHLHEFFGATTTAFDSTPESLRASDTSCITAGDTAAYWVPALYDGDRRVVPFAATAYYHPVPVPRLRLNLVYLAADGGADVTLSSGGPETMHADFVNAWDQQVLEGLVTDCLQAATRCGHLRR
jgi:hypothetical protein